MEGLRKISVLLILVATLHHAQSYFEQRTALHIPEKIIGGVIDIVHSHKNKPQAAQYPPNQQNYQYPQYQQWNQPSQAQGQYQGQFQGQAQGQYYPQNTASYPPNNAPMAYPQTPYPGNVNQYPQQNLATQSQAQGQYQYPQNNQFQSQAQQGQYQGQGQTQQGNGQYQGQVQQQNGFQAVPSGQNQYPSQGSFQGQNQGQLQGQNQGQLQGQNQGQFQGQNQGQFQGQNQSSSQYGQESSSHFQAIQGSGGVQSGSQSGFQVTGGHTGNQGPACVCQAWTKPNAQKGDIGAVTLEKTEFSDNTEM